MKFWRARANAGMSIVLTCPCIVPEAKSKSEALSRFSNWFGIIIVKEKRSER